MGNSLDSPASTESGGTGVHGHGNTSDPRRSNQRQGPGQNRRRRNRKSKNKETGAGVGSENSNRRRSVRRSSARLAVDEGGFGGLTSPRAVDQLLTDAGASESGVEGLPRFVSVHCAVLLL